MKAYITPEEVTMMEEAADNLRDRLLVRVLFRLGCRVSEALAIKVSDIDFQNATVTIVHLKCRLRVNCPNCKARLSRRHAYCPGCGSKIEASVSQSYENRRLRVLPLDPETLDTLRSFPNEREPRQKAHGDLIFGINRHRAWQIVSGLARKVGLSPLRNPETGRIQNVSPHRLRDAFAVHAMRSDDSGDGLRLLQEHLGHASFNTTAKYRKIAGEEHRKWYDRLWGQGS